ncbi:MAG: hypothetical protein ACXVZV_03465 [Terriglobales bacterium]
MTLAAAMVGAAEALGVRWQNGHEILRKIIFLRRFQLQSSRMRRRQVRTVGSFAKA